MSIAKKTKNVETSYYYRRSKILREIRQWEYKNMIQKDRLSKPMTELTEYLKWTDAVKPL